LVSVRNASEARDALASGARVIDVKEPAAGPLGAAAMSDISGVVETLAGAATVTVATGEIGDRFPVERLPAGVVVAKLGLAGAASGGWRDECSRWASRLPSSVGGALVAYADWPTAQSPPPVEVLLQAAAIGCRGFVVDTWSKGGGCSLDLLETVQLRALIDAAIERDLMVVLAGSITTERVAEAAALRPTFVGVRGAACVGGRSGVLDGERVREILRRLDACRSDG
jgi:uncharacterized protein (UPF0264 family)